MKILTILVFSGDRFNVKDLLNDISKLDISKIKVAVVEWSENRDILFKKRKIYRSFIKKKLKILKCIFKEETGNINIQNLSINLIQNIS